VHLFSLEEICVSAAPNSSMWFNDMCTWFDNMQFIHASLYSDLLLIMVHHSGALIKDGQLSSAY
jgi:hypothetical protein